MQAGGDRPGAPTGRGGRPDAPERFVFLLLDNFSHMAFTCAVEPLRIANLVTERELYAWSIASEDGRQVAASNRSVTLADRGLEPLARGERLFVVSGYGVRQATTRPVLDFLRRESRHGTRLGAICSGAWVLAAAGLLDGLPCAIHWEFHDSFADAFPDVRLRRSVFVAEAPVVSASGGLAAADLMLHFVAGSHGPALATDVADQMVYNTVRGDDAPQRYSLNHRVGFNETLKRAVALMEEHVEEPLSTQAVADAVGISLRQLERTFGKYLHTSPKHYYTELRLRRAHALLTQTDAPIVDIAIRCGFFSHGHFTRLYRQVYGRVPSERRRAARAGDQASRERRDSEAP